VKRTAIPLDPDLETLLRLEAQRRKQPVGDLLREAIRSFLAGTPATVPPGAGAFESGYSDTAERAEEILGGVGFGDHAP
jgi:hypothetical protein